MMSSKQDQKMLLETAIHETRTDFVSDCLVSKCTRCGLAKEDGPPLPALSEFHNFIVDLMCKFSSGGDDYRTNATLFAFHTGYGYF